MPSDEIGDATLPLGLGGAQVQDPLGSACGGLGKALTKADPKAAQQFCLAHGRVGLQPCQVVFDRKLVDIFALQDDLSQAIVTAIAPKIASLERERALRKPPDNMDAWDMYQRGLAAYSLVAEDGFKTAIEHIDKVHALDPSFAPALAMAANARNRYALHHNPPNSERLLEQARDMAKAAMALDPDDAVCLSAARSETMSQNHDLAISMGETAVVLNPIDSWVRSTYGVILLHAARPQDAIIQIDHALRLSPRDANAEGFITIKALCLFCLAQYEDCLEWAFKAIRLPHPRPPIYAVRAAVLSKLGRMDEARAAVKELQIRVPDASLRTLGERPLFGQEEPKQRLWDALRAVGLPE